jgi:hypothetical protein
MKGDILAGGVAGASATFTPAIISAEKFTKAFSGRRKKSDKPFGWCHDCPEAFYSAAEFSDHIHNLDENGKLVNGSCPPNYKTRR